MNCAHGWQDQILCILAVNSGDNLSADNNPQLNAALAIAEAIASCTKELSNLSIYKQRHFRSFERSHDRLLMLQTPAQRRRTEGNGRSRTTAQAPQKEQAEAQEKEAKKANAPCTYG